jgi:hypothetical protein
MTREEAIAKLKECQKEYVFDEERGHTIADEVLCDLLAALGYADVVQEWDAVRKWYS